MFKSDLSFDPDDFAIATGFDLDIHGLLGQNTGIFQAAEQARAVLHMKSRFILHQHKTGRRHFDLRLLEENGFRTWSLLQEPPGRTGQRRLAIERETFPVEVIRQRSFSEDAFGEGPVQVWDEGEVEITASSGRRLNLVFHGVRIAGRYRLRRMMWYPGNHWLFEKE